MLFNRVNVKETHLPEGNQVTKLEAGSLKLEKDILQVTDSSTGSVWT